MEKISKLGWLGWVGSRKLGWAISFGFRDGILNGFRDGISNWWLDGISKLGWEIKCGGNQKIVKFRAKKLIVLLGMSMYYMYQP